MHTKYLTGRFELYKKLNFKEELQISINVSDNFCWTCIKTDESQALPRRVQWVLISNWHCALSNLFSKTVIVLSIFYLFPSWPFKQISFSAHTMQANAILSYPCTWNILVLRIQRLRKWLPEIIALVQNPHCVRSMYGGRSLKGALFAISILGYGSRGINRIWSVSNRTDVLCTRF